MKTNLKTLVIRKALIAGALALTTNHASANCIGSETYYTCFDGPSGNSYSVNKIGNSTYMNGYNAGNGSRWSQDSHTFGNTTNIYGRASDGSSWNETITPYSVYGRDSDGDSFYYSR
jgi:hypothetical protein